MKTVSRIIIFIVLVLLVWGSIFIKSYGDLIMTPPEIAMNEIIVNKKKNEINTYDDDEIKNDTDDYNNRTDIYNTIEKTDNTIILNETVSESNSSIEKIDNRMENVTTNVSWLRTLIMALTIIAVIALFTLSFLFFLKKKK
ncbi:MAG: hypothetical protein IKG56_05090 [Clostridia bacterium]|nr:hypothetical protein [Clostridia bacterium]